MIDNQLQARKGYAQAIKITFRKGTSLARKAFTKFVKLDSVASTTSAGSYFDRNKKKVYLNASKDFNKKRGIGAYYFHEHGHYIDFFAAGAKNSKFISMQNTEFGKKLRSDYAVYLEKTMREKGVSQPEAEMIIAGELEDQKRHGISDIIDGLTDGKVHGCAQHSHRNPDYWKPLGRIEREAFANMFQSCFEPESARYMAEYFPEAYREFKKMIKGVVG